MDGFEGQSTCSEENAEKCLTFSVPMEQVVARIDKKGNEIINTISHRLQFIDSARFMASLVSNLANDLAEGIHKIVISNMVKKRRETCGIKYKDCNCFLEYANFKDDVIE